MNVKTDTIIRTIVLALALINQVLAIVGVEAIPIAEEDVYQIVTIIVTVGASVWAWWKNNSFTKAAIIGDMAMNDVKERERK